MFKDTLHIALNALLAKKSRSLLSILGIVIGILTVSGLLTLTLGVKNEVVKSIEGLGANLVIVLPGKVTGEGGSFTSQVGASTLTENDIQTLRERVPEARNLSAGMLLGGTVKTRANKTLPGAVIFAWSPGTERALNIKLASGRFTDENDENSQARVTILGATAAETLFNGGAALGQHIEIRGSDFTVVGVLKKMDAGFNFGGPDMNSLVIMPLKTGWEISGTKQIFRIMMQAPDAQSVDSLKDKVRQILLETHRGEEDFSALTQNDLVGLAGDILDIITALLTGIAVISLIVGGIGIMNIMLVSVSERTREIGTRKAVGATRKNILLQFLIESVLLTLFGGLIALFLFTLGISLAQGRVPIPLEINPFVMGLSLVFSAVVGIIFGIVPAWQASKKEPVEALRYE